MRRFEWAKPDTQLFLSEQYVRNLSFLMFYSHSGEMRTLLGKAQLIKAIDDGGVSMCFQRDPRSSLQSRRIVLSVEVTPLQPC